MSQSRWAAATGGRGASGYDERFTALAASGVDVHGEAGLVASLAPAGAWILDAGCGTGRVATRLAELGFSCVGVDNDPAMLDFARRASDAVSWRLADLLEVDQIEETFDVVVAAGNVIPLLAPGSEPAVIAKLADRLRPGGALVAGFGLDAAHLPLAEAPFGIDDYDTWCTSAGLELDARWSTWDRAEHDGGGYAVSLHRRPAG